MWASLAGGDDASAGARSTAAEETPEPEAPEPPPLDLGVLDATPGPGAVPGAPVEPELDPDPDLGLGLGLGAEAPQQKAPAEPPGPRTTEQASAALEARLDRGAIAEAIEAAASEEFAVPMRARTFAALSAVALAAVFALGFALGARSNGATGSVTPSDEPGAGPRGADGRRVAGGFALPAPQARADSAAPVGAGRVGETSAASDFADMPAADRAFLDPVNQASVLAIRYKPSPANVDLAWETHATLKAAGLPVVSPVHLEQDRMIYLFVGAEETEAQLTGLLDRVKRFEIGPLGRREFASAQPVGIDRYR